MRSVGKTAATEAAIAEAEEAGLTVRRVGRRPPLSAKDAKDRALVLLRTDGVADRRVTLLSWPMPSDPAHPRPKRKGRRGGRPGSKARVKFANGTVISVATETLHKIEGVSYATDAR